jgi:hypothetical protein
MSKRWEEEKNYEEEKENFSSDIQKNKFIDFLKS